MTGIHLPRKRDFWVGLWMIPFSIFAGAIFFVFWSAVRYGWDTIRVGRAPIVLAISILGLFVYFMVAGWAARSATERVYETVHV